MTNVTLNPPTPPQKNQSVSAQSADILLVSDSLKCQHGNRTHRSVQKLTLPRKYYLCSRSEGESAHDSQCYKLHALTKVIGLIPWILSFEQQCVIIKGLLQ